MNIPEIKQAVKKKYFDKFCNDLSAVLKKRYSKDDYKKAITEEINRALFGEHINVKPRRKFTREQLIFQKLYLGCKEIDNTYTMLVSIRMLIKGVSITSRYIPPYRIISYHYGNYLNEVYMLRERLNGFQKVIFRIYNRNKLDKELLNIQYGIELLLGTFNQIVEVRGSHVHSSRIELLELKDLAIIESVNYSLKEKAINDYYKQRIKDTKRKIMKQLNKRNKDINNILQLYFALLYKVVFSESGEINIP